MSCHTFLIDKISLFSYNIHELYTYIIIKEILKCQKKESNAELNIELNVNL